MTDHYNAARHYLTDVENPDDAVSARAAAAAQVHATLALADAVRHADEPSFDDLIAANREGTQEDYDRTTRDDAEIERLREEVAMTERYRDDVIQACAAAERERDDAMQAHTEDIAAKDAEFVALTKRAEDAERERDLAVTGRKARVAERDRFHGYLASIVMALGDPGGAAYDDLPRLVRELRDERDKLRAKQNEDHWSDMLTNQECSRGIHADWWVDSEHNHLCPWCTIDDLKGRAVVHAASPGPARPGGTSEAHFQTQPQSAGKPESTSSREPKAPGFQAGDRVWHVESGTVGEVVSLSRVGSVHVTFDGNETADAYSDRGLRHVYDVDHEPPEGVNVVRDSRGMVWARHESFWRKKNALVSCRWSALVKARGPELVEHREGDDA